MTTPLTGAKSGKRVFRLHKECMDSQSAKPPVAKGRVYLVGAGPGDPELLTVKAQRLLAHSDVILHDDLVPLSLIHI